MTNSYSKLIYEDEILNSQIINQEPNEQQKKQSNQKCNTISCTCWLDKQWKKCKTYDNLLKCMKKYYDGYILNMPLTTEPFDCDDPEFRSYLIKLSECGAFIVDTQEFKDEIKNNTRYKQREYLNFGYKLKPNQTLSTIMEKFDCKGIYYMALEYYRCNNPTCKTNCKEYYQTDNLDKINFENDEIWISKHQKLNVKSNSRIYKKTMHVAMPEEIDYGYDKFAIYDPNFYDNLIIFNVWNNIWERVHNVYMIDKIIECLK